MAPQKTDNLPIPRGRKPTAPIEYLMTLRRKGLSHRQIAELIHVERSAVTQRLSGVDEAIKWTDEYTKDRALIFAYYQRHLLAFLTPTKLRKASARDLIVGMGILYDKERLETGQSTANIAYADILQARINKELEYKALVNTKAKSSK
jgi:transcriptional regulator with XRE-family HTH domain